MLWQEMARECALLRRVTAHDGQGGAVTAYEAVGAFSAALVRNSSSLAHNADRDEESSAWTVTTEAVLEFDSRFSCDGKTYRVVSAAVSSPATFKFNQYLAEEVRSE